jgi:SAM-dependent methyltransferase
MPVTFEEEKAISFGSVAETYDRVRPGPAPEALDWLVPDGCEVAVDLAAGTGLFTRELLGRAARVVAVEPDPRMREVLGRASTSRIRGSGSTATTRAARGGRPRGQGRGHATAGRKRGRGVRVDRLALA